MLETPTYRGYDYIVERLEKYYQNKQLDQLKPAAGAAMRQLRMTASALFERRAASTQIFLSRRSNWLRF
ncbi:Hypothetical protein ETEE_2624 [Edwardsiella anguillarum ET080813]|uniref:Uncharacterized protein n=1 Tax=Edwardsiella anguillarum ET080813 TaxID=667120 RepID=A0A076LKV0_9GAMM|nr:Hypothetical protein ETEE_2624 [Edwardsiella anguillarum ET080813]